MPVETVQTNSIGSVPTVVSGWGGGTGATVRLVCPGDTAAVRAAVARCSSDGMRGARGIGAIARGVGSSYGDAAQLAGGLVLDMTRLRDFQLDAINGTITAQAGLTIKDLLMEVVPAGWMLPVVPGTQHVTVAGAIASDIHGKNHGTAGTFGSNVQALGLLAAGGDELELQPGSDDGVFAATVGGMGLTGVILWARIKLKPVASALLAVDIDRVDHLDDALTLLAGPGGEHRVAWLDLLGAATARGIVTRAQHASDSGAAPQGGAGTVTARATVPVHWPGGLLRTSTVRAYNELRFRRAPRRERGKLEEYGAHMFPLDTLNAWPRLYGRPGFVQYQFAVPRGQEHVLAEVIELLRGARIPCFLAVLKDLGAANDAFLSFPLRGWTLALDLPRTASGLDAALDRCDELVAAAGGRVYLTKDVRLRSRMLPAMYPRLHEWRHVRDRVDPERRWRSDLALRTGLVDGER
jgi:decaprenylphospho-beta-D-ribofuranose 2-oxidase